MTRKGKKKFLHGSWTFLGLTKHSDYPELELELTLTDHQEGKTTNCRFSGVSGLTVGNLNFCRSLSLEVKEITGDWPDGLKYDIIEIENEMLLFKCVSVAIDERF